MKYELRDGKYYKVEEIDLTEIEKEVRQVVAYIEQQEVAKAPYMHKVESLEEELHNKKVALENEIARLETTYANEIEAYRNKAVGYDDLISKAKESLKEKEEIVRNAFPNECQKIGF